jgi:hypothetical protein
LHAVLPGPSANWPGGQSVHIVAPCWYENDPGGHTAQVSALLAAERVE